MLGGSGGSYAPPGKFCKLDALRVLLRPLFAQSSTTVIVVIRTSSYVVQKVQTSEFPVLSSEYCIGLLSLGRGHNVARLNTRALRSLRHAARLENSWSGQSGFASI